LFVPQTVVWNVLYGLITVNNYLHAIKNEFS